LRLGEIVIETRDIEIGPGQFFTVRGLNLNDLIGVAFDHSPALVKLYDMFMAQHDAGEAFTMELVKKIGLQALREFPDTIFLLIAHAADEPEAVATVRRLPLMAQLEAMEQIVILSIKSEAMLKKLQEIVLRLIEGVTTALSAASETSRIGFGKSAGE
jgi:hypothetical protein